MKNRFGLSVALALPVHEEGPVDLARMVSHAKWCLGSGCSSVTVFGTTGEGASLGMSAREQVLGALSGAGINMRGSVVGGVAAASIHEAVGQSRLLVDAGCRGILMAPPFYFKGVTDDGLFAWFAQVFDKLGAQARDVILYNIPSVTAVPLSLALIGRLREAYPDIVTGVKDSSGDFAYTQALLAAHSDIAILIGDERSLSAGMSLGAQGSISGLANICPGDLVDIIERGKDVARVPKLVDAVLGHPVVPAVKALIARQTGDAAWMNTRAPLVPLPAADAKRLYADYDALFATENA